MSDKITAKLVSASQSKRLTPFWCTQCMQLVTMVSVEEAAAIFGADIETLIRNIEEPNVYTMKSKAAEQSLHTMKSSAEVRFICLPSLWQKSQAKALRLCVAKASACCL